MIFKRRDKETFGQKVRIAIWPRRSLWRSIKYLMLRVLRLTFIWGAVLAAGRWMLYGSSPEGAPELKVPKLSADMIWNSFDVVWPVIKAMAIGSLPVGIPVAFVIYLIVRQMARIYQTSRLKMLADTAKTNWAKRLDSQLQTTMPKTIRCHHDHWAWFRFDQYLAC